MLIPYVFNLTAEPDRLQNEILQVSQLKPILDHIEVYDLESKTILFFIRNLTKDEFILLSNIISRHWEIIPAKVQLYGKNGVNATVVESDGRIPTRDILKYSYITAEKTSTINRSVIRVGNENLTNRSVVEIINTGNVVIYVGANNVTATGATRGRPINPRGSYVISISDAVDIYIISASNCTYVVVEGA